MTLALMHPGLLANLALANTGDEVRRVIDSLTAWSRVHDSKAHSCHISEETRALLYNNSVMPSLPMLNILHSRFGDETWHPNLLIQAWFRLLAAQDVGTSLPSDARVKGCENVSLTPCTVEDDLPEPLGVAARHDAALLANAIKQTGGNDVWIVAASTRKNLPSTLRVHISGEIETEGSDNGAVHRTHIEDELLYVFDPKALDPSSEEDRLYAELRKHISGMQALVIGGDGRDFDEQTLCDHLGLVRAVFVQHWNGPGHNIKRARQMLRTGKYSFYVHITRFGSHSPGNLKDDCPPHCRYIAVNGSATALNIARAIAYVLHIPIE